LSFFHKTFACGALSTLSVQTGGLVDKKTHCFSLSVLWLLGASEFDYKVASIQFAHNAQRQVERQFLPQEYQMFFKVRESAESFCQKPEESIRDWVDRTLASSEGCSILLVQQYKGGVQGGGFSHCLAIKPMKEGGFGIFDTSFGDADMILVSAWRDAKALVMRIIEEYQQANFQPHLLSKVCYYPL